MKTISVWLILKDGPNVGKIVLQQRAENENDKTQSFPFVLQATISGKSEPKETTTQTMLREAQEELGPNFKLPKLKLFYKSKYKLKGIFATCYNYYGQISKKDLAKIKLHSGALPELKFIGKQDLPALKPLNNNTNPKEEFVLFSDQLEALQKLFSHKP